MDPTCIKKVIMQKPWNPWNPWLLLKVPKQLRFFLLLWRFGLALKFNGKF